MNLKKIIDFFCYTADFILLINFIILVKYFNTNNKSFKIFTLYCATMILTEFGSLITAKMGINNHWISHFYYILQFLILSWFFYTLLNNKTQKLIILLLAIFVPLTLFIMYLFKLYFLDKHNLFETFITSFTIIIYATFHLYNMLNKPKEFYYITSGILFYLFGSTIIWLGYDLVCRLDDPRFGHTLLFINALMYVIYQIFVFIELQKNYLNKTHNE
jgi:hypothetical protein